MLSSSMSDSSQFNLNNNNNIINTQSNQTNDQTLPQVFGPFYHSSKFFIKDITTERNKLKRLILILCFILFIMRSIYYIIELFRTQNLTITWARTSIQLTFTLNALTSLIWIYKNGNEYFNKFIYGLQNIKNHQSIILIKKSSFIRPFIFLFIFIFTSIIWCSLQIIQISQQKEFNITDINYQNEEEENFLKIYPLHLKIFLSILLNLFPSLLAAYIGGITLGIFFISFRTVLYHWEIFKKELFMPALENGQIINLDIFNQIEYSFNSLLRLSHNTSDSLASLGMGMFINSIFLNLAAGFISGGGGEGSGEANPSLLYNVFYHINNINWSVLSIILLLYTLKGPYAVHSIIREIKDQLLLNELIWINNDKEKLKLCERTKNLIQRIEGIQIHRIGQQLFNLVFIAQMVMLWLLVANSKSSKK